MQIELFKDGSRQRTFIEGQPILAEAGEKVWFVLLSGSVDEYDARARLVASFGPGRCFNARAFFFGDESATYIAHTDSVVQILTEEDMLALLRAHPTVALDMLKEAYATAEELAQMEAEWDNARKLERLKAKARAIQSSAAAAQPQEGRTAQPDIPRQKTVVLQQELPQRKPPESGKKQAAPAGGGLAVPSFYLPEHVAHPEVTHPEYSAYVFEKEMLCPSCGAVFQGHKIFQSKLINIQQPRYDLRPFYKDFQMEWYDVVVCPQCYFSTLLNLFLEPKNFSKSIVQKKLPALQEELRLDFSQARNIEFVFASQYLALQCADAFLIERQISAKLWGTLSWLYEDVQEAALEKAAALKAAEENERLYLEGKLSPAQEQMIAMVIAGMLYRAGERADIKHWLFEVKKQKTGKRVYTDLADNLLEELRGS